ncbi:BnaC09g09690D [Brassica napus]|uniref:BnaC09g09690D protein n=1 Tax=Brassica napus TaxID=3708 RepID=A0A078IV29_BRANA|nr:BnaC09g09690D [Brassica napus]
MFPSSDNAFSLPTLFSVYASITGFMMLFRKMLNDFMPMQLRSYLFRLLDQLFTPKSNNLTVIIDEKFGSESNHVFEAAEIYLRKKISPDTKQLCVGKTTKEKHFTISIVKGEEIFDSFENSKMKWNYVESEENKFNEVKPVKLYSKDAPGRGYYGSPGGSWGSITLDHPSTFDTLAMDPSAKKKIIDDLERFLKRKEFYKRVGKAWKRGYLLYGPPGTGKSSLIAAMANYLKFDIFDLELSSVQNNGEFKRILLSTTNRSILVIEDIDCNAEVRDRESRKKHE